MPIGKDLVTVVVPTFNEEKAIGLVLDELLEVGYKNVLVVDGYSEDGTVKAAEGELVQVKSTHLHSEYGKFKSFGEYMFVGVLHWM